MFSLEPTITIVIPTFKRPESLRRCLISLSEQNFPADEILVVVQEQDLQSLNLVEELGTKFKKVDSPGIVFAILSSLAVISTDLVAFIDDDVTLPPDWVIKAKNNFSTNPKIGALGGTDLQANIKLKDNIRVGIFTGYGKLIGNHHLASGPKRYVDFLKGCNMVLRTSIATSYSPVFALLKGNGAQVGNDLVLSLSSRLLGFRTLFDPDFFVFHHVEPRKDSSQRHFLSEAERMDAIFNSLLIKLTFSRNFMRPAVLTYQLVVGDRDVPGLVRSVILRKKEVNQTVRDLKYLLNAVPKVWKVSSTFREPLSAIRLDKTG
jgi:glycosyltransferase involved in cell wall biosynthesis